MAIGAGRILDIVAEGFLQVIDPEHSICGQEVSF
jgi:hypothetical protein